MLVDVGKHVGPLLLLLPLLCHFPRTEQQQRLKLFAKGTRIYLKGTGEKRSSAVIEKDQTRSVDATTHHQPLD